MSGSLEDVDDELLPSTSAPDLRRKAWSIALALAVLAAAMFVLALITYAADVFGLGTFTVAIWSMLVGMYANDLGDAFDERGDSE